MGPSSQPGRHELWAEVAINSLPASTLPEKEKINRVLILEDFRNDRDVGELIRTARSLAWDTGFLCASDKLDVYSPEAFRASRLQTIFFPMETTTSNDALQKSRDWGCVPIFLSPLPKSQLENSEVGRPHFWRNSGNTIEESELTGKKVALIASQKERFSASPRRYLHVNPTCKFANITLSGIIHTRRGTSYSNGNDDTSSTSHKMLKYRNQQD